MSNKLLEDAKASGFDVGNGIVTVFEKQYSSVSNSDITEKLAKFAELQKPLCTQYAGGFDYYSTKISLCRHIRVMRARLRPY